jgi:hypothetical protein
MRQRKYLTKNPNKFDEILILILNKKFDAEVNRLRRDFMRYQPFLLQRGHLATAHVLRRPKVELDRAIARALPKFGLPSTWLELIRQYVLTNDFLPQDNYDPDGVVLEIESRGKTKPKEARLILHEGLTKDAVVDAWSKIRKELDTSTTRKRKRVPKQFGRDYEIYKLHDAGKSWREISIIIKNKYGDDFYEGVFKNANSKMKKRLDG